MSDLSILLQCFIELRRVQLLQHTVIFDVVAFVHRRGAVFSVVIGNGRTRTDVLCFVLFTSQNYNM